MSARLVSTATFGIRIGIAAAFEIVDCLQQVVQMPDGRPQLEEDIKRKAKREMRLIVLGFEKWDSNAG